MEIPVRSETDAYRSATAGFALRSRIVEGLSSQLGLLSVDIGPSQRFSYAASERKDYRARKFHW